MKLSLLIFSIIMISGSYSKAQVMKHFNVEKSELNIMITPKFIERPDTRNSSYFYVTDQKYVNELMDSIRKKTLPANNTSKFTPKKSRILIYFDPTGKVFYIEFWLSPEDRYNDDELLCIFNGFIKLKFDMSKFETRCEGQKKFNFGIYWLPLVAHKKKEDK